MKDGLKEINDLSGVWGSFIADNRGEIMFSVTPPDLKEPLLEDISSQILELLVSSVEHLKELSEIVFHYAQKKLFVVDLEDAILAVVCTPSVDISLLRMSVNVVRTGWDDDPKVQTLLKKNSLERL
jgi:predicted regulator of Ras-like GTPase activity (Roadblock/LC7/MglB family)